MTLADAADAADAVRVPDPDGSSSSRPSASSRSSPRVVVGEVVLLAERITVRYARRAPRGDRTLRGAIVERLDPHRLRDRRQASADDDRGAPPALRDVTLALHRGEVLGVIGRNGAGKTTLLQTLAGVFLPDAGRVVRRGRTACLLSLGAGFNGNLSGRENVHLNGAILGVSREAIAERLESVLAFSDLGRFVDAPVRTYSAGMRARLGFSVALLVDPEIVILDEILRVGDAAFREKAGSLLDRFRAAGKAIVLASHSMEIVRRHCDRVVWLDRGAIRAEGRPEEVARAYLEDAQREPDRLGAAD